MNLLHILLLALIQGVTELFPISSLGHTVIIPGLLGWHETLSSPVFLPLVVALHLGTATALLTFFWRDWVALLKAGFRVLLAGKFTRDVDPQGYGRQLALVVVGSIPAGLVGLLLQKPLESLFSEPVLASSFLVVNGAVLLASERLWARQRSRARAAALAAGVPFHFEQVAALAEVPRGGGQAMTMAAAATHGMADKTIAPPLPGQIGKSIDDMSFAQAAVIGFAQSFALLPGISRSGATMVAGLASGLSHEAAARFSFLLATPIILAAGLLEVPKLFQAGTTTLEYALLGGVVAGVAAFLSVRFLMRYFETNRLDPFAWYCIGAGLLCFTYFAAQTLHLPPF